MKATDTLEASTPKKAKKTENNPWEVMEGINRDTILLGPS